MAIRRGDWKLILGQHGGGVSQQPIPEDPDSPPGQLFHLGRDLGESSNVYEQHPEIVRALSELLEEVRRTGRSAPVDRRIADGSISAPAEDAGR
jgi:hypothetical protein